MRPEFALIDWIRQHSPVRPPVLAGIGDDAAVLQPTIAREWLIATDMLLEGVHFLPDAPPERIGRKALAVNLSDFAAMGGQPQAAFVSLGLPAARGMAYAQRLMGGLLELAAQFGVTVAGGDTNTWSQGLVINVAVTGVSMNATAIRRTGAQPGDWLFVTGSLGGSLSGRHFTFSPRVAEAQYLLQLVPVHAMLDVSDGLSCDLPHLLGDRLNAELVAEHLPIAPAALAATDGQTPLARALHDGEDFELLFAVAPDDARTLLSGWQHATRLTHIGHLTAGDGTVWVNSAAGSRTVVAPQGWTHCFENESLPGH